MSVVKSGYLRKHSKSILSGGWNRVWVLLYQDSNLVVYKKQGDSSPMGTINLFEVRKWFAYGQYTSGMSERPDPPKGETLSQILAIPQKPSKKAKIHWFLADTEQDLHVWMDAICKVLPAPPQKEAAPSSSAPIQPQQSQPVSSAPPPYPGGPGPSLGFDSVAAGPPMPHPSAVPQPAYAPQPAYPQQAAYPQQPYYHPPAAGGYPQQAPPPAAYPQQTYYPGAAPAPHYVPQPAAYPQQPYYAPQGTYYQHPPQTVVVQQKPRKGGFLSGGSGNMAMGLIGGAALGYGMSRMGGGLMGWGMGGSWSSLSSFGLLGGAALGYGMSRMGRGGLMGWGMRGSWSSLSSFGSCGSFGSFGSF